MDNKINTDGKINTTDDHLFFKIMKSNFLLMLYNLIEASVTFGLSEIYEKLKNDTYSYSALIDEIKFLWSDHEIGQLYNSGAPKKSYVNKVRKILSDVISKAPIKLNRNMTGVSGNLDAGKIKAICNKHKIRCKWVNGDALERVKNFRQQLAHGDLSFGECTKDLTVDDLEKIKDEVLVFLKNTLDGMSTYYDNEHWCLKS
jgi:hypothetical protein